MMSFEEMDAQLKGGGVRAISAPQLFQTPKEWAREAAGLLGIRLIGTRWLEPSAGLGALVRAGLNVATGFDCVREVVAVEVNAGCVEGLELMRRRYLYATPDNFRIIHGDFLDKNPDEVMREGLPDRLGKFDCVLMNPPFINGADIRHIEHARGFLEPGGRLVSFCANGPRQRRSLRPLASEWIDLPAGSFKASGTGVNAALLAIDAA